MKLHALFHEMFRLFMIVSLEMITFTSLLSEFTGKLIKKLIKIILTIITSLFNEGNTLQNYLNQHTNYQ